MNARSKYGRLKQSVNKIGIKLNRAKINIKKKERIS